jgi:hypothetical protein
LVQTSLTLHWHQRLKQHLDQCRIKVELYSFKNNDSPILHVELGQAATGDRHAWKRRAEYQDSFRRAISSLTQFKFCPTDYCFLGSEICLRGTIDCHLSMEKFKVSDHCHLPVAKVIDQMDIDLNSLPIPEEICLNNIALVMKNSPLKTSNTFMLEWANLNPNDHHGDHANGHDDDH